MLQAAIEVENLSKRYRIGSAGGHYRYRTFREAIIDSATAPLRRFRHLSGGSRPEETIWALRDVSVKVQPGEVLGVIGRNGAGKSTLLKVLSRITPPTRGRVRLRGRVASLLEVGTGFHPELTGRENIYLNGSILGMKKGEIQRQFDAIVAFAEVSRFVDTPVKRYSSGMYLRLAFAVAAHLQPEILLVDETLAVGDAAFQKKCLGKMGDVARDGRTVLFVSHNLGALANLCPRALLLVDGMNCYEGRSQEVIRRYVELGRQTEGERVWKDAAAAPGSEKVRLHAVRVVSGEQVTPDVDIDQEVRIEIEFWNYGPGAKLCSSIHLLDHMGVGVLASANMHSANLLHDDWFGKPHPVGLFRATCTLPANFLNEGRYSINAVVLTEVSNAEVFAREVVSFTVHDSGAMRKEYGGAWLGVVRPKLAWQTGYLGLEGEPVNGGGMG